MDYYTFSSDEDDCEGLLKQALEVKITDDFNPNSVPRDGYEFLQQVIYERKHCKTMVTSNINPENYIKNQTITIEMDKPLAKCDLVPTKPWQFNKLAKFQEFRLHLQSLIDDNQTITTFNEGTFMSSVMNEPPVLSKLSKLAQCAKVKMLELLTRHINSLKSGLNIDDGIATWIFAILALLDIPLSPNDCFVLREFSKRCVHIRSSLEDKENNNCAVSLNFFICVVGRFFGQTDLAD